MPYELEESLGLLTLLRQQLGRSALRVGRGVRRREVKATFSAGLASRRRDGDRSAEVLGSAQGALWRAKSLGGDRLGIPDRGRMTLKSRYSPQAQLDQLSQQVERNWKELSLRLGLVVGDENGEERACLEVRDLI